MQWKVSSTGSLPLLLLLLLSFNFLFRSLRASPNDLSHISLLYAFMPLCFFIFVCFLKLSDLFFFFFFAGMKVSDVVLKEGLTCNGYLLFMYGLTREVSNTHTRNQTSTKLIKQTKPGICLILRRV